MKYLTLAAEDLTLPRLLTEAKRYRAVFLKVGKHVRYVLTPADDGDEEVCALQNSAKFMAYLEECAKRAKMGRTRTLAEIRAKYGVENKINGGARRNARKPR